LDYRDNVLVKNHYGRQRGGRVNRYREEQTTAAGHFDTEQAAAQLKVP
jgi:hypothetical protein